MDVSYIIENKSDRLKTTFPNIFALLSVDSANLSKKSKKNHFSKKNDDFWIKMRSRGAKSDSIGIAR